MIFPFPNINGCVVISSYTYLACDCLSMLAGSDDINNQLNSMAYCIFHYLSKPKGNAC